MRLYRYRLLKNIRIFTFFSIIAMGDGIAKPVVILNFADTATVNDTAIFLRDIASISVDSPEIKQQLSVLFAGAIAPPGYSRFINTSDLVQYCIQPAFKDLVIKAVENKRITVKTTGIVRNVGDYSKIIGNYLEGYLGWKQGEWSFVIDNDKDTWKTLDLPMKIVVEGTLTKAITPELYQRGHIQLQLVVNQRERTSRIPVSCFINVFAPVVIARHPISRGTIIAITDLELKKVDLSKFSPDPYFTMNDLLGQKTICSINQGSIFFNKLLTPVPVISKGDNVAIKVTQGNVRISVMAIARENGEIGQKIWVENTTTHKLVRVMVKDKNSAKVL
jgi:flagella basal body P-ring formation protein FlgA